MSEITVRTVQKEDLNPVRYFLREFFIKDEPLNRAIDLTTEDNPVNEEVEEFIFQEYGKGYDVVAEYEGRIVGVCLNGLLVRGEEEKDIDFTCSDEKFNIISEIMDQVEKEVNYFGRYPDVDKILSIQIISVDSSIRRKGIAKKLVEKSKQIAKENGAEMVAIDCTSYYSTALAKSLGFEQIYSKDYSEFKKDGKQIVKPADPHKAVAALVFKL